MAHFALQELWAVAMMLCRMAFWLFGKVVALNIYKSTAKAYLCNQGGTVSPFLCRLAWHCSIHSYPSQCGSQLSVMGMVASRVISSLLHCPNSFSSLGSAIGGSVCILPHHSMSTFSHLGNSTTSGGLGFECIQPSLEVSGKLCLSFSCICSSSSVQVSGGICHRSVQTFDSDGTIFDGGSLASHSSQQVGRCFVTLSCCKRSHYECFSRPYDQGSFISEFIPSAAQRYMLCRQGFSSLVCQAVVGAT